MSISIYKPRAGTSGAAEFETEQAAREFADRILRDFPPEGYGTQAVVRAPDGGTHWTVTYWIGTAD